jgi:hypothetical protein
MSTNLYEISQAVMLAMKAEADRSGTELRHDIEETARYAEARIDALQAAYGQPGYDEAMLAEADAIALHAAVQGVSAADRADEKVAAAVRGALSVGIQALMMMV